MICVSEISQKQIKQRCILVLAISTLLLLLTLSLIGFKVSEQIGLVYKISYISIGIFVWSLFNLWVSWRLIFKPMHDSLQRNQEALQFLKLSLDSTPDMIWWINLEDGRYHAVNGTVCRISGYSEEEMLNKKVFECISGMSEKMWPEGVDKVDKAGGGFFELKFKTKDNRVVPFQAQIAHVAFQGKKYGFAILQDIVGQKQTDELTLQAITSQQEALLNNIPHIAWIKDEQSRYTAVNEAYARFCKRKREELIGLTDFDIWPKELAEKFIAEDQNMIENGEKVHFETLMQDPQGTTFWAEIFKTPINHDLSSRIIGGSVGIALDITDRKAAETALKEVHEQLKQELYERKVLESQLIQSQKMESVGQLAAGVAHEINNPIGFVQSNLNMLNDYIRIFKTLLEKYHTLQEDYQGELHRLAPESITDIRSLEKQENLAFICEDVDLLLEETKDGLTRVKDIVQGLKSFAHPEELTAQESNINECLESTLKIIGNELKYKCTVDKQFQELPLLMGYPGQLNQVFLNILINASQAIPENGKITIQTACEEQHVIITITDNGEGIHPNHLDSIFNPFFTTKPVGQGTGLGLSISYGIIQKHQGTIDVASELGKGSTFTIRLPVEAEIGDPPLAVVNTVVS